MGGWGLGVLKDRILPTVILPLLPPLPGLDFYPGRGEETLQCTVFSLIEIVDGEGKAPAG